MDASSVRSDFKISIKILSSYAKNVSRVTDTSLQMMYRVTTLVGKRTPLGPYRRPMPRVLGGF
jgi:hypothetical protein